MGHQRYYLQDGGFSSYLYHQVGDSILSSNGLEGKVLDKIENDKSHDGLPLFSNTSEIYFKRSDETGQIEQARIYDGRLPKVDLDWEHGHGDIPRGIVHVHEFHMNSKGKWIRIGKVRLMTDSEIYRYGELLLNANYNIRFK